MSVRGIFICYRHEDSQGEAGRIDDHLRRRYGADRVFRDVYDTPAGVAFPDHLVRTVATCDAVIVVIGRRWLGDLVTRRDRHDDWVRAEVRTALDSPGATVIPVLVHGASMPAAGQLPEDIRSLATIHAHELTDSRWEYDMGRLMATVDAAVSGPDSHVRRARAFLRRTRGARVAAIALLVLATTLVGAVAGAMLRPAPAAPVADAPPPGPPPGGPPGPPPPGAPFLIQSVATGRCVASGGRDAVEADCAAASPDRQWRLNEAGDGQWEVVSVGDGRCLAASAAGAPAVESTCTGAPAQHWRLDPVGGARWWLVAAQAGACLDGGRLTSVACVSGSNGVTWRLLPAGRPI